MARLIIEAGKEYVLEMGVKYICYKHYGLYIHGAYDRTGAGDVDKWEMIEHSKDGSYRHNQRFDIVGYWKEDDHGSV